MSAPLALLADRLAGVGCSPATLSTRVLDIVGAIVRGSDTVEGAAIARHGRRLETEGWADGPLDALARLVAIARLSELDDIHMPSLTTPGAVVVPVALHVAAVAAAPADLLAAGVAAGYEAMTRLGRAIGGAYQMQRGLWPTAFAAPFGAAAVTARILQLDRRETAEALGGTLGIAIGAASGVRGAALSRWLSVGDAARAGCTAAFAARDGFVADVDLERVSRALALSIHTDRFTDDEPPAVDAVSVKPYPCAKQCIAAAEAATRLRASLEPGALESIEVLVPADYVEMVARPPDDHVRLSRVASAAWNVALALEHPGALLDPNRALSVTDPAAARLVQRTSVRSDEALSELYPDRFAATVIVTAAGRSYCETVIDAAGDPGSGNQGAAVVDKWRAANPSQAERWIDRARSALAGGEGLQSLLDALAMHQPAEER